MTAGAAPLEPLLARLDRRAKTLLLTHYGRKSGKPYVVRIWFTVDGDHVNLQTMSMQRQWTRNVLATPKVSLQVGEEVLQGEARPVSDPTEMKRVVELMKKKYLVSRPYLWIRGQLDGAFRVTIRG
jgi:deazaflavin-dependent oxidoreductase (nitroreductase family)